jgi:hypothetical protein
VVLVSADVSEKHAVSIIKVARIGELVFLSSMLGLLVTANVVRFEVFTAVTMKNGVFWDVTPCGSCKNRRFRGT